MHQNMNWHSSQGSASLVGRLTYGKHEVFTVLLSYSRFSLPYLHPEPTSLGQEVSDEYSTIGFADLLCHPVRVLSRLSTRRNRSCPVFLDSEKQGPDSVSKISPSLQTKLLWVLMVNGKPTSIRNIRNFISLVEADKEALSQ